MRQGDAILEGVKPTEMACLKALAAGGTLETQLLVAALEAKGWVEMVGGVPIITLTGRALLDHPPVPLR